MKVLYLGVYRDGTGYGHAAMDYILAMDAAGINVVPRPIKLNDAKPELPARILELEDEDASHPDVVVQHILPHMMDRNGKIKKNIGLFATETSDFKSSKWASNLNTMDENWVICNQQVGASQRSGVKTPIKVIPHACNIDKYQQSYDPVTLPCPPNQFVFYFIGEATKRKNIGALVKAFHLEFRRTEPVQLLLKVNKPGMSSDECEHEVAKFCNGVKDRLKLYPDFRFYKKELILAQHLPEKEMMRLHATCNCFVMPSYGEAWCIPAFDAMAMGKTPICTNVGGMADFLQTKYETYEGHGNVGFVEEEGGWLVPAHSEPVFDMNNTFANLYTGQETWESIDVMALRKAMREAYENKEEREKRAEVGMALAYNYSYEAVGEKIKEVLHT
jgi:glycosyltransferase involved in cell wall biosynthesis